MTAPLTPPHQEPGQEPGQEKGHEPEDNPWRAPEPGQSSPPAPWPGFALPTPAERAERAALRRADLRDAAVVTVAVAVLGIALGLLWLWLAPRIPLISDGKAVFLKDTEGEGAIGADGTFALLGLAFGALSAAGVFLFRRRGGVLLVLALAVGGLLGSLLAWRFGIWFGPTDDVAAHAREVGAGVTFDAPLKMRAYGVLLAWPLGAMVVHLALTALFGDREPATDDGPAPDPWGPSDR
ncbi:ABC transporter permease [Streptomyces qinzhouensis]|uniref:ABC transporter permease n=1 Tax=Streptomyces qinzhouensis TaxID=2599401 RepID=A0A5B8IDZ9_9ACTN|nr:ABC transporter permease [Streptomyces qinzhouensis]QDY76302.1 ABC transporter permease [Streptomyces qinzhouensis]